MLSTICALMLAANPLAPYGEATAQAIQQDRPLVIFVGVPAMPGPWVSLECCTFNGVDGKAIVVGHPRQSYIEWADTLEWWSDADTIQGSIQQARRPVQVLPARPVFVAPPVRYQSLAPRVRSAANC